jgi:hypothetical protein
MVKNYECMYVVIYLAFEKNHLYRLNRIIATILWPT